MESTMECNERKMWSTRMPEGLDLEISHHPMKMKHVVNLIIAMERLKAGQSESALSTEFRDEHLLSIMLESVVEEHFVIERRAAPPDQFSRTGVHQCSVTDSQKRSFVLVDNSMELHSVMLQGGSDNRKVFLNMSTYVHPSPSTDAKPVALGIKDTDFYLSCHMEGETPTLHLETVTDKRELMTVRADSENLRFLFYKRDTGVSLSTLMSARFPNWYISTAKQEDMKVEMCKENAERYRTFNIQRQI